MTSNVLKFAIVLSFLQPTIKCILIYLIFRYCVKHAENYAGNESLYKLLLMSAHLSFFIWWILNICYVIFAISNGALTSGSSSWWAYLLYTAFEWLVVFGFSYLTIRIQENFKQNKFAYSRLWSSFNYGLALYFMTRLFLHFVL